MNSKTYRWCAVPQCTNTSIKTPNKLFVFVPYKKTTRYKWLKHARRDLTGILPWTQLYFCEDHFDMPNDMVNYMEYHIMGTVSKIRMKPGCTPTKFECQEGGRKRTCSSKEPQFITKKEGMMTIANCLKESETNCLLSSSNKETSEASSNFSTVVENVQEILSEQMADDRIEVIKMHKFRSKTAQTYVKSSDQALLPSTLSVTSSTTYPFKAETDLKSRPSIVQVFGISKITKIKLKEEEHCDSDMSLCILGL